MDPREIIEQRMPAAGRVRARLLAHPITRRIDGPRAARVFMQTHVFAVWDFMSLLKSLQQKLTCVTVPWIPPTHRDAARLINEIVLVEESDDDGRGRYAGHYDIYLEAMANAGADTKPIERFTNALRAGQSVEQALVTGRVNADAAAFVRTTLAIALDGKVHEVAAAFFLGREGIIPSMFDGLRSALEGTDPRMTERLVHYLTRHIEVDGDAHGPASARLLTSLCEDDDAAWAAADDTAVRALEARIALWDGVLAQLDALPPRS